MNILLLDGGKAFGHSHGGLNHTLHKKAKEVLTALGHNVQETVIDAYYDVEAEIENSFDGCCDLADAGLVDARALDSEKIYGRSLYRRTRQTLPKRRQTPRQSD